MTDPKQVALVITDQFSLFGYAVAAELFRFANAELGFHAYLTTAVSTQPGLVKCSNGTEVNAAAGLDKIPEPATIILCSNANASRRNSSPALLNWVRRNHRQGKPVCALGSAVWTVAQTGIVDGFACAAHWTEISALRHEFSNVMFTRKPFTTTNRVWICSGGDSVSDMMLHFLGQHHGLDFTAKLRRALILKPNLANSDPRDSMFHSNSSDMELTAERFLALVETAIEEPMSITDFCNRLNVSQRTLNRYCHTMFGQPPKEVYLEARLRHAKILLTSTSLAIGDIAAACGFSTAGHFAQVFNDRAGSTPSGFRSCVSHNTDIIPALSE